MLTWFTVLLYPASLLMVATLFHRRVSLTIMLLTQALIMVGPLLRFAFGEAPFSGFENSALLLTVWVFVGLLAGWPIAERLRREVDRRRESITSSIILPQAFHSALYATIITTMLNLFWQELPLGWPIYNKLIGNFFGVTPTLIVLVLCLVVGLIGLPKYLSSVLYRR
ncbi:MAG: hypothetical protein NVSMB40_11180 [Aquirhabdus sp.]